MTLDEQMEHLKALKDAPDPAVGIIAATICGMICSGEFTPLVQLADICVEYSKAAVLRLKARAVLEGQVAE